MTDLKNLPYSMQQRSGLIQPVLSAVFHASDPNLSVKKLIYLENRTFIVDKQRYDLDEFDRIFLIGFGKAVIPMSSAVSDILGEYLTSGLIISKHKHFSGINDIPPNIEILTGNHPFPGADSIASTLRLIAFTRQFTSRDLVVCVISGGGSALFTSPYPGIYLEDLQKLTSGLLGCGATIDEMNTIRKHLDRVKGGGLSRLIYPATALTFILSDVIGNPIDVIASGPTVADPSTFLDALDILRKYSGQLVVPDSIIRFLLRGQSGEEPETLKPGAPELKTVMNTIVASNELAAKAAVQASKRLGFTSTLLTTSLQGEASGVGRDLAAILRRSAIDNDHLSRPMCFIAGGETTVTLHGNGVGGRNTELALGSVESLAGLPDVLLLSLATDGEDGPTNAAGAVVTGETLARAIHLGLDPGEYLRNNNSYVFFEKLQDLLITGSTGTNVNDIIFLFAF